MGRWRTGYHQGDLVPIPIRIGCYAETRKPDITFFGQALDSQFEECLHTDREKVDLLLIIGTSLKVAPVSEVLSEFPIGLFTACDSKAQRIYRIVYLRYS
jgi:NAD-dependent SIR2 family protein deacetylase